MKTCFSERRKKRNEPALPLELCQASLKYRAAPKEEEKRKALIYVCVTVVRVQVQQEEEERKKRRAGNQNALHLQVFKEPTGAPVHAAIGRQSN